MYIIKIILFIVNNISTLIIYSQQNNKLYANIVHYRKFNKVCNMFLHDQNNKIFQLLVGLQKC